eukprot:3499728-Alexandrium_andersonii.AAC.1
MFPGLCFAKAQQAPLRLSLATPMFVGARAGPCARGVGCHAQAGVAAQAGLGGVAVPGRICATKRAKQVGCSLALLRRQ